jgi:hypothetical protein
MNYWIRASWQKVSNQLVHKMSDSYRQISAPRITAVTGKKFMYELEFVSKAKEFTFKARAECGVRQGELRSYLARLRGDPCTRLLKQGDKRMAAARAFLCRCALESLTFVVDYAS